MEGLLNKAEFILDKSHETLIRGGCGHLLGQPLFQKLVEIYCEEAAKIPRIKSISLTHHLLEKLTKRDNLNCLIVNLYRGNEGYSLAVKLGNGVETETVKLQYEDEEFLSYIDNEQLPPMLLDLFDDANIEIFHSGCIIAEIRDFRRSIDSPYESRFVLLKPNNQSLAADIANLTRDKDWTSEERLLLEAEIVRRTAPPLNLSPSPIIALINNKVHQHKYKFSGVPLKKAAKRFSQVAQNRQKKFEEAPPPKSLRLHGFLSERKDKRPLAKSVSKPLIPMATDEAVETSAAENFDGRSRQEAEILYQKITEDIKKVAQPLDRLPDIMDNSLVFVEEYTLETERGQGRIYLTKLTISQRRTDEIYFGELYVDRDYQEGKQNGAVCRFQLGNLHQVQRHIKQFKEILTEEGRKTVKITHKVAGQPPRVAHTPGTRDKKEMAEQFKQQHQLLLQQQDHNQTQQQQQQQQQIKQGIISGFSLSTQQPVTHPLNSAVGTVGTIAQTAPQNVIIVTNAEGTLKKSVNVVSKPITVTSTATITNLISAQSALPQGGTLLGQQVVVGQGLNLTNLLSGRQLMASRGGTVTAVPGTAVTVSGSVPQGGKVAVNVSAGQQGTKITLPTLASQLNRPVAAAFSQPSSVKSQAVCQVSGISDASVQAQPKSETHVSTGTSSLEALLANTSQNNSAIMSRNATLLERLIAQSVMRSTPKLQDDNNPSSSKASGTVGTNISMSSQQNTSSSVTTASSLLKAAESTGTGPPNINLANITNLPGLNVGLQNLATNLSGIQNVQVSFPGFTVPIPLTLSVPVSTTTASAIIVTSPSPSNMVSKSAVTTSVTSSSATVMIAGPSGLQQGQVVQLPIGQLSGSQLAAQLTKSGAQVGSGTSSIPLLQVQGVGGPLFTSVQGGVTSALTAGGASSTVGTIAPHTVQVAVPATQNLSASGGDGALGSLTHTSAAPLSSSIVTLTSKQPLTVSKQPSGQLTWQLNQKLMAAKRQQQLQQQQQQQPPK